MLLHTDKEEAGFVKDLGSYLHAHDRSRQHRKNKLCQESQEKAYQHIQSQIDEQINALSTTDLTRRRRALMEDYIRVSNTKTCAATSYDFSRTS